jgi:hypothetical protein
MEWLENNAYSRQLNRSGMRARCGVYILFALVLGWFATMQIRDNYCILQSDSGIQVEGYVESYRSGYKRRSLEVAIEYQGNMYTVTRWGQNFTWQMFEEAIATRRVTVYVNPGNPEKSVLSLGVQPSSWVVPLILAAGSTGFLFMAGRELWHYYGKGTGNVES